MDNTFPFPYKPDLAVVIIDDEEMVRGLQALLLRTAGITNLTELSGRRDLETYLATSPCPDVVITDFEIEQGFTAYQVIELITQSLPEKMKSKGKLLFLVLTSLPLDDERMIRLFTAFDENYSLEYLHKTDLDMSGKLVSTVGSWGVVHSV